MGFFKTLKHLFQGHDITRGGSGTPLNRAERRAQEKHMRAKKTEETKIRGRAI